MTVLRNWKLSTVLTFKFSYTKYWIHPYALFLNDPQKLVCLICVNYYSNIKLSLSHTCTVRMIHIVFLFSVDEFDSGSTDNNALKFNPNCKRYLGGKFNLFIFLFSPFSLSLKERERYWLLIKDRRSRKNLAEIKPQLFESVYWYFFR